MVSAGAARTFLGIVGNLISFAMFLCPVPTIAKIWANRAVEEFSPIPYLATLLNCMLWMFYGLPPVHPHNILIAVISGVGAVLEFAYIIIFLAFSPAPMRLKVWRIIAAEVLFMVVVIAGVLLGTHTHETRSLIVGLLCCIFGTCMYASSLSVVKLVIQTQSVMYMPFYPCLIGFLNSVCWLIYGFLPFNIFIIIPNVFGTLLGLAQLILYVRYNQPTPRDSYKPIAQHPADNSEPDMQQQQPADDSEPDVQQQQPADDNKPDVQQQQQPADDNKPDVQQQPAVTSADVPSASDPLLAPPSQ